MATYRQSLSIAVTADTQDAATTVLNTIEQFINSIANVGCGYLDDFEEEDDFDHCVQCSDELDGDSYGGLCGNCIDRRENGP